MATINQKIRIKKIKAKTGFKKPPQQKAVCIKIFTINPRKPNSAIRKVASVLLKNKQKVTAYIPGEKHNLQQHSTVIIHYAKLPDLPGVKHKIIRGVLDLAGVYNRKQSRSKYGTKKKEK